MFANEDLYPVLFQHLQPIDLFSLICACKSLHCAYKAFEEEYCSRLRVVQLFRSAEREDGFVAIGFVRMDYPAKMTYELVPKPDSAREILRTIFNMIKQYKDVKMTAFVKPHCHDMCHAFPIFKTHANIEYYKQWFSIRGLANYADRVWPCYISCQRHRYRYCESCHMPDRFKQDTAPQPVSSKIVFCKTLVYV